ncbi:MAG: aquaporin family protein, partial [Deltaproteobacteria bacterium]
MTWPTTIVRHGHKYLIEGVLMAVFMLVLAAGGTVLEHPASPIHQFLTEPYARRVVMGMLAGATLIGLIYTPWGQTTGAHLNPAVTLAYWQVGKIGPRNAIGYIIAQCLGAYGGMAMAVTLFGDALGHPAVQYVTTQPGQSGSTAAFAAEWSLSFLLMVVVRTTSLSERWAPRTGLCVGLFVMIFVAIESPVSGMSLNPARTIGASIWARDAQGLWIYLVAPPLGMLCAAEVIRLIVRTLRQAAQLPNV